jgi:hypothetical protein
MIPLPPGCTVNRAITIDTDSLTDSMVEWYQLVGGDTRSAEEFDSRHRRAVINYVKFGKANKWCHHRRDGSGGVRLHFHGDDASTASIFLLKFYDHVQQHNLHELYEEDLYK